MKNLYLLENINDNNLKKKILEFLILPTRRISHIYGGH